MKKKLPTKTSQGNFRKLATSNVGHSMVNTFQVIETEQKAEFKKVLSEIHDNVKANIALGTRYKLANLGNSVEFTSITAFFCFFAVRKIQRQRKY